MRPRVLLWLAVLAGPAAGEDVAFRTLCEASLPPPSFKVQRVDNGYGIDHRLSYRELNGLGEGLRRQGRDDILGLTQAESTVRVEVRLSRLQDGENRQECISPEVLIIIEYKPIKIYIGREFPKDGCFYGAILQHEMRHLRVYREHFPMVEKKVRAEIGGIFDGRIQYGEYTALAAGLKAEIRDRWLPAVDRAMDSLKAIQAEIDTPEEYARIDSLCGPDAGR